MSAMTWWKRAGEWMRATAVPVDDEKIRLHDAQRIRWTPVRVEPQRIALSRPQCRLATSPPDPQAWREAVVTN